MVLRHKNVLCVSWTPCKWERGKEEGEEGGRERIRRGKNEKGYRGEGNDGCRGRKRR